MWCRLQNTVALIDGTAPGELGLVSQTVAAHWIAYQAGFATDEMFFAASNYDTYLSRRGEARPTGGTA